MYNCDRCRNKGICKFEDDARALEDSMKSYSENADVMKDDIFSVSVRCSKFYLDRKPYNNRKE